MQAQKRLILLDVCWTFIQIHLDGSNLVVRRQLVQA
jgi:hypothetical protein